MALSRPLLDELKRVSGKSDATLSRWAGKLNDTHGPMRADEARWIIAHDLGVDLRSHLDREELDRVAELRSRGARWPLVEPARGQARSHPDAAPAQPKSSPDATPRSLFDARDLHPRVVRSSRKLFVSGSRTEATRKAFQAVNNRVKKTTRSSKDGSDLMFSVLGGDEPTLAINERRTESESNEQRGFAQLFAGAMLSQRNPRSHEDDWPPDEDTAYVLECLSLASLLHRILDRVDSS